MAVQTLTFSTLTELQTALDTEAPRIILPADELDGVTLAGNISVSGSAKSAFELRGNGVPFAIDGRIQFSEVEDFLVENIRGLEAPSGGGGLAFPDCKHGEARNCTVGHATTFSYSSVDDAKDILFYRCLSIYPLSVGGHPDGEHSKSWQITAAVSNMVGTYPDRIRLEECGTILSAARNPQVHGNLESGNIGGTIDVHRCVFYGWGGNELEEMGDHFGGQWGRGAGGTLSDTLYLGNDHSTGPAIIIDPESDGLVFFDRAYHLTAWPPTASPLSFEEVFTSGSMRVGGGVPQERLWNPYRLYNDLVLRSMPKWGCQPWASGETMAYADLLARTGTPGEPDTHQHDDPLLFP